MTDKDYTTEHCQRCGAAYADYDGLGLPYCADCGHCEHDNATGDAEGRMICDYCGSECDD